jgi:hypothetical protein
VSLTAGSYRKMVSLMPTPSNRMKTLEKTSKGGPVTGVTPMVHRYTGLLKIYRLIKGVTTRHSYITTTTTNNKRVVK